MLPYNTPLTLLVPQDIMHAYAKRVRALRIQYEITQKELALRVGVAEGTINWRTISPDDALTTNTPGV